MNCRETFWSQSGSRDARCDQHLRKDINGQNLFQQLIVASRAAVLTQASCPEDQDKTYKSAKRAAHETISIAQKEGTQSATPGMRSSPRNAMTRQTVQLLSRS
jgi:hypothetical protein